MNPAQNNSATYCKALYGYTWSELPLHSKVDMSEPELLSVRQRTCPTNRELSQQWVAALRGPALNSQKQCNHIKTLTIRSGGPLEEREFSPTSLLGNSGNKLTHYEVYRPMPAKYPATDEFRALVLTLLEVAVRQMGRIEAVRYLHPFRPSSSASADQSLSQLDCRYLLNQCYS
jgi:hypothetical protein